MKMMSEIKSEFGFSPEEDDDVIKNLNDLPWDRENIIMQFTTYVLFKDKYPVTEGHMLFVPRSRNFLQVMDCYSEAYKRGILGVEQKEWDGFNIGMNIGDDAGQTIFHCHIHIIPRRHGDTPKPKGGIRGVIPEKQSY